MDWPMKTTVVNKHHGAYDVDICRPGPWGNPFHIGADGDRAAVIARHKAWLVKQPHLMARLCELRGKRLGCVCKPRACHGDTLAALADAAQLVALKQYYCGDVLDVLRTFPDKCADLIFGSPPYEDARNVPNDGFPVYRGQAWVDWMVEVCRESLRVCRGLVALVMEGRTRHYSWSGTPVLLMADLIRAGITLRKPPIYERDGVSGSGGPDWLKNRYEFVVCATNGGQLRWSNNVAMGHPPVCGPGGNPTNRKQNGSRTGHGRRSNGLLMPGKRYTPPKIANPGNIIDCGAGGGGHLGSQLAHENEAPFPEKLVEFFIRSFAPPGGLVLDPFAGSGTVGAVALKNGRRFCLIDVRASQIRLCKRRIMEVVCGQSR